MQIDVRDIPELRVAAVPHVGPYNQIGEAFGRLGRSAGPAGLFQKPEAAMLGIYYDDPDSTPPDRLRSDAAIVVADKTPVPADLVERRLPAGRYACALHVGPYEKLPDAWTELMGNWLPSSGHSPGDGPSYEYYLNDPTDTPKEKLKTEIRVPLAD